MNSYRELWPDFPQEYETLRTESHQFAQDVLRPASLALDAARDAKGACGANSPLRQALEAAYHRGYHTAPIAREFGGLGLSGLGLHILLEELGWGSAGTQ